MIAFDDSHGLTEDTEQVSDCIDRLSVLDKGHREAAARLSQKTVFIAFDDIHSFTKGIEQAFGCIDRHSLFDSTESRRERIDRHSLYDEDRRATVCLH